MKKFLKNKKGVAEFGFLIVIVIACILALIIQLEKRFPDIEKTVGDEAIALLKTQQQAETILLFVDYAGKYSAFKTVYDLAERGGFSFKLEACGLHNNYTLWNFNTNPKKLCTPNVYDNFGKLANKNFNSYADAYKRNDHRVTDLPGNNYDFLIEDERITGISTNAINLNISHPSKGFIGQYSFKPSFTVDFHTGIRDYGYVVGVLQNIAKDCVGKKNETEDCVKSKAVNTRNLSWQIKIDGEVYFFDITQNKVKPFTFDKSPVIKVALYVPHNY